MTRVSAGAITRFTGPASATNRKESPASILLPNEEESSFTENDPTFTPDAFVTERTPATYAALESRTFSFSASPGFSARARRLPDSRTDSPEPYRNSRLNVSAVTCANLKYPVLSVRVESRRFAVEVAATIRTATFTAAELSAFRTMPATVFSVSVAVPERPPPDPQARKRVDARDRRKRLSLVILGASLFQFL